jgi:hypothetical protein
VKFTSILFKNIILNKKTNFTSILFKNIILNKKTNSEFWFAIILMSNYLNFVKFNSFIFICILNVERSYLGQSPLINFVTKVLFLFFFFLFTFPIKCLIQKSNYNKYSTLLFILYHPLNLLKQIKIKMKKKT